MALRVGNVELLPPAYRDQARAKLGVPTAREPETKPKAKRSKYGATRVNVDGILFDSKREARRYERLKLLLAAGEIKRFHRQPIFDLEGGVIYRADFLVVHNDDRVVYEDAKGVATKEYRMKRRMVRARYGVEIVEV
jgi:hypothetical protein